MVTRAINENSSSSVTRLICVFIISIFCIFCSSAHAIEWQVDPSVHISHSYTDNANASGIFVVSSRVTEVSPSLSLMATTPSSELNFNYSPIFHYRDSGNEVLRTTQHPLNSRFTMGLLDERLKINAGASITRFYSDETRGIVDDSVAIRDDYTEQQRAFIEPMLRIKLGRKLEFSSAYKVDGLKLTGADSGHSLGRELKMTLEGKRQTRKLNWELHYTKDEVETNSSIISTMESSEGRITYELAKRLALSVHAGSEKRDDESLNDEDRQSHFIGAGARWLISEQSKIDVICRSFDYGDSCVADGRIKIQDMALGLNVAESREMARDLSSPFNDSVCEKGDDCTALGGGTLPVTDGLIDGQNINLYGNLIRGRVMFAGQVSRLRKHYVNSSRQEQLYQGTASVTYRSPSRSELEGKLIRQHNTISLGVVETRVFEMNYRYLANKQLSLDSSLRTTQNDSVNNISSYREQRFTIGVMLDF